MCYLLVVDPGNLQYNTNYQNVWKDRFRRSQIFPSQTRYPDDLETGANVAELVTSIPDIYTTGAQAYISKKNILCESSGYKQQVKHPDRR